MADACAYQKSGGGVCNSTTFAYPMEPLTQIQADLPADFKKQWQEIIPASTFKDNGFNRGISRVGSAMIFVSVIGGLSRIRRWTSKVVRGKRTGGIYRWPQSDPRRIVDARSDPPTLPSRSSSVSSDPESSSSLLLLLLVSVPCACSCECRPVDECKSHNR